MEKEIFQEYTGKIIEQLGIGAHTENFDNLVVFKDQNKKIHCMPSEKFFGMIIVNGKQVRRFNYLGRL